jgi:hypothetical protein
MLVHRDAAYVKAAGDLAAARVEAATRERSARPPRLAGL